MSLQYFATALHVFQEFKNLAFQSLVPVLFATCNHSLIHDQLILHLPQYLPPEVIWYM